MKYYYAARIETDGGATEIDGAQVVLAEDYDQLKTFAQALAEKLAKVGAERDRLRKALDTILMLDPAAEDAAFLAVTVAGEALQEAGDE